MSEQELHQESGQRVSIQEEEYINHRLFHLHLDEESMAEIEFADPSPPRYGNNTPLKRRLSSSALSPSQKSDEEGCNRLISAGFHFLHLPIPGNENAAGEKQISPPLRRCFSLDSPGSMPIQPAEIANRGTPQISENQTRRALFPPSVNGSTAKAAHPLPPLARTVSDPTRISCRENPILPVREKNLNSPCGSGYDTTQESTSVKRLKRVDSARKIRQQMEEIKDLIDEMVNEDDLQIKTPVIPETDLALANYKVPADDMNKSAPEETVKKSAPEEAPSQEELLEKETIEDDLEPEADTVKAERVGECTFLEFKCRCGSGYSVGIIGNSCFYKLI